jgi:hypothetical protein
VSRQPDCTSANTLDARARAKLSRILSRLASPFENERAIAGLLASAFIAKHGLIWSDLTTLPRPHRGPSVPLELPIDRWLHDKSKDDRRLNTGRDWRGYCRRRRLPISQAINLLA